MSNTTQHTQGEQKRHPFSFTIGKGPYKYVGSFDFGSVVACLHNGNVGGYENGINALRSIGLSGGCGSCAHCGTAILNIQIIRRGDGKLYGVGSDCVFKCSSEGDISAISEMERKIRYEAAKKRREKAEEKVRDLTPEFELALVELQGKPHPHIYFAEQGKTLADYYRFVNKNPINMKAAIAAAKGE